MLMRSNKRQGAVPELAEIGRLLHDLQAHLEHLGRSAASETRRARSALPETISDTWSDLSDRVSAALQDHASLVGKEATRAGGKAWRRIEHEMSTRPLTALAIAAGIGFLIGAMNRR
jgi:ElaB/YqjD/DUF883 family membrane-anchored ribosome-binding protein